ncbi:MAG: hypothetical protein COA69_00805 [Robiginitomaculum sp.]|nr:MAG: hypothetical protein COA69_00805 [Robiginitomaculum sp.]
MNIGPDKIQHFVVGVIITVVVGMWLRPYHGFTLTAAVAGAKEVYDIRGSGTPDWLDFLATMLGAVVGYAAVLLLRMVFRIFETRNQLP